MEATNQTFETKPNLVPADWVALGAKYGYDPKSAEALRFFIVGPSGEGKTTFLSSCPDTIIFDFDDGANAVVNGKATRIFVKDYDALETFVTKLVADAKAKKKHWVRVGFDTIDEFVRVIKHQLEKEKSKPGAPVEDITEFGGQGHGYNLILERLWSKVRDLEEAEYSWAFIGHLRTKQEFDPIQKKEITKIRESVYPIVAQRILSKSDFKLTVYCIPYTEKKYRTIQLPEGRTTQIEDGFDMKHKYFVDSFSTAERDNKSRGVPTMDKKFEVPLCGGWDVFKKKYEDAVEVERKQQS